MLGKISPPGREFTGLEPGSRSDQFDLAAQATHGYSLVFAPPPRLENNLKQEVEDVQHQSNIEHRISAGQCKTMNLRFKANAGRNGKYFITRYVQ